jgi:HSP20 family protein
MLLKKYNTNNLLDDFEPFFGVNLLSSPAWTPAVDIRETKECYLFDVEVPGIDKDKIHVSVEDDVLTISGEKEYKNKHKEDGYYRLERSYGKFSRSFTLPETTDVESIQANYKDGVLGLSIAKKEVAKPKKIDVKVAA